MSIGTIYKGATGLLAFSKGLDVISNNVANLNTPGFKRSNVLFRELFYQYQLTGSNGRGQSASQLGQGVAERGTTVTFAQGQVQETGIETDAAINGNGLFILRDEDVNYYTRAGQFVIDGDGYLVSSTLDARVAGIDEQGNLTDINVSNFLSNPPRATSELIFNGNLSTGGSGNFQLKDIEVIDSLGEKHKLTFNFENVTPTTSPASATIDWSIDVMDENGDPVADAQDLIVRFNLSDGEPSIDSNQVAFNFTPVGAITLNFGEPGGVPRTSSRSGVNNVAVAENDGLLRGVKLDYSFDSDGTMVARYSNGETADIGQLALGWVDQLQSLRQIGNGLFLAPDDLLITLSPPAEGVMGEIVGSSIEISNIELTQEFTDLIIVQRGFQGSSQVVTAANEMLQQLLDIRG